LDWDSFQKISQKFYPKRYIPNIPFPNVGMPFKYGKTGEHKRGEEAPPKGTSPPHHSQKRRPLCAGYFILYPFKTTNAFSSQ
jgi:hypothetical protein